MVWILLEDGMVWIVNSSLSVPLDVEIYIYRQDVACTEILDVLFIFYGNFLLRKVE